MLSNTLYARLSEDANLTALVGEHVYPTAPQTNDADNLHCRVSPLKYLR
ncbi:hypothetical protein VT84_34715 [Gemmata sp. SH-PL17]|nr:DUF3168 domain-containing protein [Gemmata sp. SH-PL17]AMV29599.1 hypothetical protein VT84_34715 [Gemmata sp. SH-PL17]